MRMTRNRQMTYLKFMPNMPGIRPWTSQLKVWSSKISGLRL